MTVTTLSNILDRLEASPTGTLILGKEESNQIVEWLRGVCNPDPIPDPIPDQNLKAIGSLTINWYQNDDGTITVKKES